MVKMYIVAVKLGNKVEMFSFKSDKDRKGFIRDAKIKNYVTTEANKL